MGPVVTLPNLVSVVRILLVPLFLWLILGRDDPVAAGWLLGLIGATDWVDGYLARRLDQVSEVGKLLDPLADRLAVAAALVAALITGDVPRWFAAAVLAREVGVGAGALYAGMRWRTKIEVRRVGKLATLLVYAALAWLLIGRGADVAWLEWAGWAAGVPGLVLYYVVAVQYASDVRRSVAAGG